ncbi:MAG TPA: hypothetical protein VFO62_05685 [Candidatus Binatia bacterium]|nr:hypothetical protein [Candidatus Binatia bacterium]
MIRVTATAALLFGFVFTVALDAHALECGDVDASGSISASDALLLLNKAVDRPTPDLVCPLGVGVPVTGQTTCYGLVDGLEIACASTGQDGELRRGRERSFTDNGDRTVTDNLTGLMWEKNSLDGTIHDNSHGYLWYEAFAKIETLAAM